MSSVQVINSEDDYNALINSDDLVVVDFHTTWCAPCRSIAPKFVNLAELYPDVKFAKVDADELPLKEVKGANEAAVEGAIRELK